MLVSISLCGWLMLTATGMNAVFAIKRKRIFHFVVLSTLHFGHFEIDSNSCEYFIHQPRGKKYCFYFADDAMMGYVKRHHWNNTDDTYVRTAYNCIHNIIIALYIFGSEKLSFSPCAKNLFLIAYLVLIWSSQCSVFTTEQNKKTKTAAQKVLTACRKHSSIEMMMAHIRERLYT